MSENVGKGKRISVKQAAIDLGYSESYADSGHLQQTVSWETQRDEVLTPALLLKVHTQGLEATKYDTVDKDVIEKVPDYSTRHRYLDSAYKLRGNYDTTSIVKHEFGKLDDADLDAELSRVISRVSEGLAASRRKEKKTDE